MSTRSDYTAQEWEIVSALPSQAAIAAAVADGVTIIGTVREFREGAEAIEEGATAYPDNELIAAILADMAEQAAEELEAERMVGEGGAPPPAEDDDAPVDPALDTPTSDEVEEVVTTSSAADTVAAVEAPDIDPRDVPGYVHEVIANARQAREILAAKATPQEIADYNAWVLDIVERVINRTRSGGFLGIGGERVGDEEAAFRDQLTAALGPAG